MVRFNKKYLIIKIKDLRALRKIYNIDANGKSKKDIIQQLPDSAIKQLEKLFLHHTANKIHAIYLSKTEKKVKLDELEKKLSSLNTKTTVNDWIFENKGFSVDFENISATLKLRVHTRTIRIHAENANSLEEEKYDFRRGKDVIIIFHIEDNVIEFKTPIFRIYEKSNEFVSNKLTLIEHTPVQKFNIKKKDSELMKKVTINNLNWAGADKIIITGANVELALNEIKRNSKLSLTGAQIMYEKSEIEDYFKFSATGQVSYKAKLKEPYSKLKELCSFG